MSFLDGVRMGMFTVPGDGCIDFKPVYDILKENNYEGWTMVEAEQDPAIANPLEYAQKLENISTKFLVYNLKHHKSLPYLGRLLFILGGIIYGFSYYFY